jgi:hypothetical protein
MEKKLTRSDFVFILVFIFMLIFALSAFFYGMKIGSDRTELKYADLLKQKEEESKGLTAYHQSYLVSFYHTVYLPFREFNMKWEQNMEEIENRSSGADASSLMKELAKIADEKYESILTHTMPNSSPLLQDAHQNYLKSLKLFSQAADAMQSKVNSTSPSELMNAIDKDAYFTEAKNFALTAQKNYYQSIVSWHQSVDETAKGIDQINNKAMNFADWSKLSLNLKNALITDLLASNKQFYAFTPQDVTLRVDEMIKNGQAKKMNTVSVQQVVDILIGTHAVRPGDFVHDKSKYYPDETLPQLPFFSKMD